KRFVAREGRAHVTAFAHDMVWGSHVITFARARAAIAFTTESSDPSVLVDVDMTSLHASDERAQSVLPGLLGTYSHRHALLEVEVHDGRATGTLEVRGVRRAIAFAAEVAPEGDG